MTISQKYLEFISLVQALNTIVFGDDTAEVTLDGITKPSISKFLAQVDALTTAELQRLRDAINVVMNQQSVPTTIVTDGTHSQERINSDFRAALQALNDWIDTKGFANGIAPLDANVKVDPTYLPQSTETTFGASKIATSAIAREGTNDTDFITAKKLRGALNASGDAPISACRAWVCFDGANTPTILSSMNILSIIRNAVGDYTINFSQAMPHSNYAVLFGNTTGGTGNIVTPCVRSNVAEGVPTLKTTSQVRIICRVATANDLYDMRNITVGVFC